MPKYLFQASYTAQGTQGVLQEGGSKRRTAIEELAKGLGGRVESFYYAFGETDVVGVMEVPDSVTAVAVSMAVNASGAASVKLTVLISPEEIDQATKKAVSYRPPGK